MAAHAHVYCTESGQRVVSDELERRFFRAIRKAIDVDRRARKAKAQAEARDMRQGKGKGKGKGKGRAELDGTSAAGRARSRRSSGARAAPAGGGGLQVHAHLDGDPIDTLRHLALADVLITSRSAFSHVAALFSHGVTLAMRCWCSYAGMERVVFTDVPYEWGVHPYRHVPGVDPAREASFDPECFRRAWAAEAMPAGCTAAAALATPRAATAAGRKNMGAGAPAEQPQPGGDWM